MYAAVNEFFFFFNDTATTEIYTLSLHDALPILAGWDRSRALMRRRLAESALAHACDLLRGRQTDMEHAQQVTGVDRKSTRLNSSHANISYAVFCLKKKKYNIYLIRHHQHIMYSI